MILVTGANGFIGQKLVERLLKKYPSEQIVCLVHGQPILAKIPRLKIIPIDLVTKHNLNKVPVSPRLVFHLAGTTDTSKRDHRCNDEGTQNLIKRLKVGPKSHFIYTSTLAIYSGRTDCYKPIDVDTFPVATDEYGKSKIRAEKVLTDAMIAKRFKLTILRLPTVWGENPRKNSFLNFLRDLVKNNSIFTKLSWKGKTALMNVNDMAKYLAEVAPKTEKRFRIIPLAAQNLTLADIFKILTKSQGKKYKQIKIPDEIWKFARFMSQFLPYFEAILPTSLYNYFWRASIVSDNALWCKVNVKGIKFTS